ncbi:MAG: LysM peptidoglycan-binding domain-containing protein [Chloroflexi bacterium]|nr:LysM peptidoglycan-binding domain-containing protein [Chloroflexota bacterium]
MRVKQRWLWLMLLICILSNTIVFPLKAQELPTATPDADGVIYAIVQPNDALWSIAARAGIPFAELLDLNNLAEDALIQPGDRLIVGIVAPPVTPTAVFTPTPIATHPPPTPTLTLQPPPLTALCLVAFTDSNGNGQREPEEPLQANVAFTIFTEADVVTNYVTDGVTEPFCLTELAAGEYQITRSVGRDETLSNSGNRSVILAAGDQVLLGFGGFFGAAVAPTAVSTKQPPAIIGDEAKTIITEATPAPEETSEERPFPIGALIIIGILLMGAALIIGRRRH